VQKDPGQILAYSYNKKRIGPFKNLEIDPINFKEETALIK
jgi:hypothetical protein